MGFWVRDGVRWWSYASLIGVDC